MLYMLNLSKTSKGLNMYDMPFIPTLKSIHILGKNMRTKPKRSTHLIEWDRLDKEQRKRVTDWLDTPTKQRAKQAFRILIRLGDQYETKEALGISDTATSRYLKDVRDCFRMILSDEPFECICSVCAKELEGDLSEDHKFTLHRGTCQRCKKHAALIPVGDYGLNNRGESL